VERFRVLLLDQRGTARSSRIDADSLALEGPVEAQAEYLRHFRADAIVRDAEAIRRDLCGDAPWYVLGQSFGGFCALNYLSTAPEGLSGVLITGGIPPIGVAAEDVYRATYRRVLARNARYRDRYPADDGILRRIVAELETGQVRLPGGSRLTREMLQSLGLAFGFSDGLESVHYLLEEAFDDSRLSFNFLRGVEHALPYESNPLFSLLQEACYCEGEASGYAASRVRGEFPQFDDPDGPFCFSGEMIYPWMFRDFARLVPLADVADIIARHADWPRLYDWERLEANTVPVAAAVYADDMYVERRFSEAVAERVPGLRAWITNEHDHDGLRAGSDGAVFQRLLSMLDGKS
jgi:pimeloyl-ACP methyl ester carboxylesterase